MGSEMCANCVFARPADREARVTCRYYPPVFLRGGSVIAGWPEVGAEEWCRCFAWPHEWAEGEPDSEPVPVPVPQAADS